MIPQKEKMARTIVANFLQKISEITKDPSKSNLISEPTGVKVKILKEQIRAGREYVLVEQDGKVTLGGKPLTDWILKSNIISGEPTHKWEPAGTGWKIVPLGTKNGMIDYSKYINSTPQMGGEYYGLMIPKNITPPKVGDNLNLKGIVIVVFTVSTPEDIEKGRGGPVADSMRKYGIGWRVNCLPEGHEYLNGKKITSKIIGEAETKKKNILYIVHPDSVLEQSPDIDHVKPFIDKLETAIKSFNGQVIVTKLDVSYHQPSGTDPEEFKHGVEYVKKFMSDIKSKVTFVNEKRRDRDTPLGTETMEKYIDDLYLGDQLGKIFLGGAFTCEHTIMCVDETYSALEKQYGKEHVEIDRNITLKAGPVFKTKKSVQMIYKKQKMSQRIVALFSLNKNYGNMKMTWVSLPNGTKIPVCENCINDNHITFGYDHRDVPEGQESRSGCKNTGKLDGETVQCSCNIADKKVEKAIKEFKNINKKIAVVINNYINKDAIQVIKTAGYDREQLKSGYKGKFLIQFHTADKAGKHFDLRLEFPVTNLHRALKSYEGKRSPETNEPFGPYKSVPGTVYRSWAVKKHTIPTKSTKLFIVETEDHPIDYGRKSKFTIPEGLYGAGTVETWDKGTYELMDVEGDKKYVINFNGEKLKGTYAFVKYNQGFLWVTAPTTKVVGFHESHHGLALLHNHGTQQTADPV